MLPRPSKQCVVGVVQYAILSEKALSAAWNAVQWFLSAVKLQAFDCAGASPNHSATWAFTFGDVIQFIHWYMQFGCLACAAIIQVSDQPVAPSEGSIVLIDAFLSVPIRLAMACQVVPTTLSPDSKAWTSFV